MVSAAMTGRTVFNPLLPGFRDDPHPVFHRLRTEDPVHFSPAMGIWVLTRYTDVVAALKDDRLSASARNWKYYEQFFARRRHGLPGRMAVVFDKWMLQLDAPDHTRLRALVNKAFTPRAVQHMRQRIEAITQRLLSAVSARGELDLMSDLAFPLPIIVIAAMLGVPEADWPKIRIWSTDLLPYFNIGTPLATAERVNAAADCLCDYYLSLAAQRRREPQDDLLSALIAAKEQDDRLSETELLGTCTLLSLAGHATTAQLIGNLLVALARHPDQWALLQADASLVPAAVEEALRYEAPLQVITRTTTQPMTIGDKRLDANQFIWISLPAANRDPEQFPDPDRFDLMRRENRHIAFGYGGHYCAGAPLARLEAQVVLEHLLKHFRSLKLTSAVERDTSMLLRGIERARLSLTPMEASPAIDGKGS